MWSIERYEKENESGELNIKALQRRINAKPNAMYIAQDMIDKIPALQEKLLQEQDRTLQRGAVEVQNNLQEKRDKLQENMIDSWKDVNIYLTKYEI